MQQSETIGSLAGALAAAHAEIRNPPLDAVNPHFKNRYATLAAHLDAIRGPLAKQGIALIQTIENDESRIAVVTTLAHKSGEWMRSSVSMAIPDRATAQNLGSLATYLRRYALAACCLIVGDADDDADGDRQMREEPRREPRRESSRDLLDPTPKAKPAAKAAASAPTIGSWEEEGREVVTIRRRVDRDKGIVAVHAARADGRSEWVQMTTTQARSVEEGGRVELAWRWSPMGFYTTTSVGAPPTLKQYRDADGNPEIPLLIGDD